MKEQSPQRCLVNSSKPVSTSNNPIRQLIENLKEKEWFLQEELLRIKTTLQVLEEELGRQKEPPSKPKTLDVETRTFKGKKTYEKGFLTKAITNLVTNHYIVQDKPMSARQIDEEMRGLYQVPTGTTTRVLSELVKTKKLHRPLYAHYLPADYKDLK